MGLLDGYFDPEQFQASGGLLGRLFSLPQMQGLYQPSTDFDPQISADNGQEGGAPMPVSLWMPRSILQANGPAVNPQTPVHRPTQDIPIGDYRIPQLGSADVSQALQQPSDLGYRPSGGFQGAHTPNLAQRVPQSRIESSGNLQQDLNWQYEALRPILGAHNAMPPIDHLKVRMPLISQALAGQATAGNTSNAYQSDNSQAGRSSEAIPVAGEQPRLSKIGYFEIPTNPNQAFGELLGIQEKNPGNTVSGQDYLSGVRDGNVRLNDDGSLEVTNGTVITISTTDGRAKMVTVTNADIARIDVKTGEVVIQKSRLGDPI